MTLAPLSTNNFATPPPNPDTPPVMKNVLPSIFIVTKGCANVLSYRTFCCDLRLSKCASRQGNSLGAGGNRRSKQKVR